MTPVQPTGGPINTFDPPFGDHCESPESACSLAQHRPSRKTDDRFMRRCQAKPRTVDGFSRPFAAHHGASAFVEPASCAPQTGRFAPWSARHPAPFAPRARPRRAHHCPIAASSAACATAPFHPALPGRRAVRHALRISPTLPQRPRPQPAMRRPVPRRLPHPTAPGSWLPRLPARRVRRVRRSALPSGRAHLPQSSGLPRGQISRAVLLPASSICS